MKIIKQSYELITPLNREAILKRIEACGVKHIINN